MPATVVNAAHIPVGTMDPGVQATVVAFGEAQALAGAAVSDADSHAASVAAGASAEAMEAADFTLPGETVQVSWVGLLEANTRERRCSVCLVLMEQVPWVPVL